MTVAVVAAKYFQSHFTRVLVVMRLRHYPSVRSMTRASNAVYMPCAIGSCR